VAKSVLFGAVPVVLFLVPMTALVWVCQSIPPEASALSVPMVAIAQGAENDLECYEWDTADLDFKADPSQDVGKQTFSPMPSAQRSRPETCQRLNSDAEQVH